MTAALALSVSHIQIVRSEVLGELEVPLEQIVELPMGLPGFPDAHGFALLPAPKPGLYWLQSVDHPALTFLLADPFTFFPDRFHIDLTPGDLLQLGTSAERDILSLVIVTLSASADQPATANLRAPLLFNIAARRGFQRIQPDDRFGLEEPIAGGLLAD